MISSLELARMCGVSQGSVDRALHNRPGIRQATRQRILEMARTRGYQANPAAREMLHGVRIMVGAILPALDSMFFLDLFQAIRQKIAADGYRLMFTPVADASEFTDVLEDFAARRFAAALVVPPREEIELPTFITENMPVVAYASECRGRNTHFLSPDELGTGRLGTRYLLSLGHRHIAHLTYTRKARGLTLRSAGYEAAMRDAGLHPQVMRGLTPDALLQLVRQQKITALFCHNDPLAMQARQVLERAGFSVPGQVSILGVDNSPQFQAICPDLTTLAYPMSSIAEQTARILRGEAPENTDEVTLVERNTCRKVEP